MKYKITIEYDGTNYCGWQKQNGKFSIQESIEKAIYCITHEEVLIFGSGRTDAGVHAIGQVAHFELNSEINSFRLAYGINYFLKYFYQKRFNLSKNTKQYNEIQDIAIINCEIATLDFHARFSAKKRFYEYHILNSSFPSALNNQRMWIVYKKLNFTKMQQACNLFINKQDWSSFRDSECQAKSPIKTIESTKLIKNNNEIIFYIEAKSFLHHMVRNIVGTIVDVGLEKISIAQLESIIKAKDRKQAGVMAPACGLFLSRIEY